MFGIGIDCGVDEGEVFSGSDGVEGVDFVVLEFGLSLQTVVVEDEGVEVVDSADLVERVGECVVAFVVCEGFAIGV